MAKSTAIVVTAGAIGILDLVLSDDYDPNTMIKISVGTVGAALVSAGLDKAVPGFGTGAAVILLVSVILTSGPRVSKKLFPDKK